MEMILDSTFVIDLLRDNKDAQLKLQQLLCQGEPIHITCITVFELFQNITESTNSLKEREHIKKILSDQPILQLSSDAAEQAGMIKSSLQKSGKSIGQLDALIAGIALTHADTVLTRNVKDFSKIKGLVVETY
jgi:tRNA(fMet)-specific endonuclease VapC